IITKPRRLGIHLESLGSLSLVNIAERDDVLTGNALEVVKPAPATADNRQIELVARRARADDIRRGQCCRAANYCTADPSEKSPPTRFRHHSSFLPSMECAKTVSLSPQLRPLSAGSSVAVRDGRAKSQRQRLRARLSRLACKFLHEPG